MIRQRLSLAENPEKNGSRRGQSMLEMAIFLPILILLIAGIVEIAMYANSYMAMLDASREAARYGANLDPELTAQYPFDMRDGHPDFPDVRGMSQTEIKEICADGETTNFYYEVACLAFQNVPTGTLNLSEENDDIVISVLGVRDGQIVQRWPLPSQVHPDDQNYHFRGANDGTANATCTVTNTENCRCWSFYGNQGSLLTNDQIEDQLQAGAPATGLVIVEIVHAHPHFIGLFDIGVIPNPIPTRPYAVFPVSAAEPDN